MNEYELINSCHISLLIAEADMNHDDHEGYYRAMADLRDLLLEELVGSAPVKPDKTLPERTKP